MPTIAPMPDQTHPSTEVLCDFVNGRAGDAPSHEIELHIENCAECCEALARLSGQSDRFVQLVADAAAREPAPVRCGCETRAGMPALIMASSLRFRRPARSGDSRF
jgi:hypothetical protein